MDILLESAVRVTVLAGIVAVLLRVFCIGSPAMAHRAWTGVAAIMLLLPLVVGWGPEAPVRILPETPPLVAAPSPSSGTGLERNAASVPVRTADAQAASLDWSIVVALLYGAGLVLLLVRLGVGVRQARRLVREATVIDGRLTHPQCVAPVTVGLFAARVILPPSWVEWSEGEIAAVIEHEQEHVRRRDPLVTFVMLLNRALFWFHPLAWWLPRQVSRLAEQACDAVVLSRGHDPEQYARSLIRFARATAERPGRLSLVGTSMPGVGLHKRLPLLVAAPAPPPSVMRRVCTMVTYAAAAVICCVALPATPAADAMEPNRASMQQAVSGAWLMEATPHFEVFYQRPQETRIGDIRQAAEEAYAHVSGQLKYELPQPVPLVIVERDREIGDGVRSAPVTAGGNQPRHVVVVSLESIDRRPRIIVHELTHYFAFDIIPEASRTAPWIAEGLARHQRGVWDAADEQTARDAVAAGRLPALEGLLSSGPYWSHALFDFIAGEYGAEGVRRYLFALRTRAGGTDAIPAAFGVTLGSFDAAFRRYLETRFARP